MFDLRFYWKLFLRRLPAMMVLFLLASGIGVVMAMRMPAVYEADARLLVEEPQIPTELAASTVRTSPNEEITIIQQQLLTRDNLLDIAREFDVFGTQTDEMAPTAIIAAMRRQTDIRSRGGRNQPTMITVSFEARNGSVAAAVVNEYVTRITSASVEQRTDLAEDTLDFFEQEVERLSQELDLASARITQFQTENAAALPSDQNFRLSRQALLQERLANASRDLSALIGQRDRLIEIFEATGRVTAAEEGGGLTADERRLDQLERDLDEMLLTLSETNPRVVQLRARIELLEETIAEEAALMQPENEAEEIDPQMVLFNLQREELDAQIAALENQTADIEEELAQLEEAIEQSAFNAIALRGLQRDYENISAQYDAAVRRLNTASVGERIELTARGQRITLIESATIPSSPSSPNRPMVAATGGAVGLGLAGGLFLLMEVLNRRVRRPAEIVGRLGITPLGTVPYIESRGRRLWRRSLQALTVLAILVGVPAALWAIDTYYMPLDTLAERVLDRLPFG